MPEVKFRHYEVFIAGGDKVFFDGRFRYRQDAVDFISNFLTEDKCLYVTDICCTEICTETDLINVNNI